MTRSCSHVIETWTRFAFSKKCLSLLVCLTACGGSVRTDGAKDEIGVGETSFYVVNYRTEESRIGVWCVRRLSEGLEIVPLGQGVSSQKIQFGQQLNFIEGKPWLFWLDDQTRRAGAIENCEPVSGDVVDATRPSWSPRSPQYAEVTDAGALRVGVPGAAAQVVEPERVIDFAWHPNGGKLWYRRRLPDVADTVPARSELFVLEVAEDGTPLSPVRIGTDVLGAKWSKQGTHMLITGEYAQPLRVWNVDSHVLHDVAWWSDRSSYEESPNGGTLLLSHPDVPLPDGTVLPRLERYRMSDDVHETLGLESASGIDVRWLPPQPWAYAYPFASPGAASLYDLSDPGVAQRYSLPDIGITSIEDASPRSGQALVGMNGAPGPRRAQARPEWRQVGDQPPHHPQPSSNSKEAATTPSRRATAASCSGCGSRAIGRSQRSFRAFGAPAPSPAMCARMAG
ncbi:MAG TPA: hypothetical protein VGC79_30380 [Polyangiaceae bacterium]